MDLNPVLRRFQQRFFKTNANGEVVPAAGATVKFTRQGATVKTSTYVPDSSGLPNPIVVAVPVYDTGMIGVGDQLQLDLNSVPVLGVEQVTPGAVHVYNNGADVIVPAGVRFVPITGLPSAYADPIGTVAIGATLMVDADGWGECYLRDYRYDFAIDGIPTPVLHLDAVGSWVTR